MEDLAKADFIKGQCPVAFEILDPFVGILDVDDPDYTDNVHSRDCCIVRTNIPSGVNVSSFQAEVGPNGKEITFTMTLIKSRLEAEYTLGKGLGSVPSVINAMEKPLTKRNSTVRRASQRKGSQSDEVKTYKLKVPKAIEKSPRNPYNNWGRVMKGATGVIVELPRARSTLFYAFFFFKEDESIVPPTAMGAGVLGYEINNGDCALNPTEQIMRQAEATIQFDRRRHKKKKNKVRSPSPVASITKSIRSMSIAAGNKKRNDDLDSCFTDESYHSEFSDDASDIDDSTIETETTRPSVHAANLLRISRVRRMQMQAPAIKTVTVPGLAGLNSIVSINNGSDSIRSRVRLPSTRRVRQVAGYDPRIDDDDDDDDDDSFASAKISSSGTTKSRSRHRRSKKERDKK